MVCALNIKQGNKIHKISNKYNNDIQVYLC